MFGVAEEVDVDELADFERGVGDEFDDVGEVFGDVAVF